MNCKPCFEGGNNLPSLCAAALCLLLAPGLSLAAGMQNYCNEPPFPAAKSNLLLMLDNSASMYDLAYTEIGTYCLDNNYQNSKSYSGYFDRNSIYRYDFAQKLFRADGVLPSGACTGSCAALTGYLYVEMSGTAPARTVSAFIASGNFLNWLSASSLDIEKQVLTGGKFIADTSDPAGKRGVLQLERAAATARDS